MSSPEDPHEFPFTLPDGWEWEITHLTGGRARLQATDGDLSIGNFW